MNPNDGEMIKWFATLGVGGILAGFMFWFYRKDVRVYTEQWKNQTELLMAVVKENTVSNTRLIASIDANQIMLAQMMKILAESNAAKRFTDPNRLNDQ